MKDDAIYIRGGYQIVDSTKSAGFSLGCGIKWNSTGTIGFLTTAHNTVSVGDVFKYGGTQIGTAYQTKNSGEIDAALIQRTDSTYLASSKNGTSGVVCTSSGTPIVNEAVTKFGNTTGATSGTITAINYNVTDGVSFTNLLKTSCTSASGDSGGAIIATRSTGNVFVGIHKASSSTTAVGVNWMKIKNYYDIVKVSSQKNFANAQNSKKRIRSR